ncbi:hypothetical protein MVEN_00447400 [Mycena venus]|uniref:Uncharacterized protein n=1 Tax=Mycena venus TaxID=2733690 RepID=A0A8H6YWS0_9AGAR|nr:hypothetical protein MVEN_00447400 [Mycena venus]
MLDSERVYVDLLFCASKKYASWDLEVVVKVGDWGRITKGKRGLAFWRKNGTFLREGNIFLDGKAENYNIPTPVEYGNDSEGETWVTSKNAKQIDFSASAGTGYRLALSAHWRCGAVLAMENAMITLIEHPGLLKPLLRNPIMRGVVIVSEVHSCSSYARLLTTDGGGTVALGLRVETPGVVSTDANARWVRNTTSGNFKSHVNKSGNRSFYPLYRLVAHSEDEISTGIGG